MNFQPNPGIENCRPLVLTGIGVYTFCRMMRTNEYDIVSFRGTLGERCRRSLRRTLSRLIPTCLAVVVCAFLLPAVRRGFLSPDPLPEEHLIELGGGYGISASIPTATHETYSPLPADSRYLILNLGDVIDPSQFGLSVPGIEVFPKTRYEQDGTLFRARSSGFSRFSGLSGSDLFCFVNPVRSVHADRNDRDWYRTQYGTGIGNCGPAVVSMAVSWSSGESVSVEEIRAEIGYPVADGSTSFSDLTASLERHGVPFAFTPVSAVEDIASIVDRGHIALVLIDSGTIPTGDGLFGRYYDDAEGHYIIVKGYSSDARYVVAYDPMPGDWNGNRFRYPDGVSMKGKNRYYPAADCVKALRTRSVIEISPVS